MLFEQQQACSTVEVRPGSQGQLPFSAGAKHPPSPPLARHAVCTQQHIKAIEKVVDADSLMQVRRGKRLQHSAMVHAAHVYAPCCCPPPPADPSAAVRRALQLSRCCSPLTLSAQDLPLRRGRRLPLVPAKYCDADRRGKCFYGAGSSVRLPCSLRLRRQPTRSPAQSLSPFISTPTGCSPPPPSPHPHPHLTHTGHDGGKR